MELNVFMQRVEYLMEWWRNKWQKGRKKETEFRKNPNESTVIPLIVKRMVIHHFDYLYKSFAFNWGYLLNELCQDKTKEHTFHSKTLQDTLEISMVAIKEGLLLNRMGDIWFSLQNKQVTKTLCSVFNRFSIVFQSWHLLPLVIVC